jgi:hypothetical protein
MNTSFLRRITLGAATLGLAAILAGCAFTPIMPPRGILYNNQKAPMFPGGRPGTKVGKASNHNILFLVGWGDSSFNKALENGGITTVSHTDYELQNYALVYQRFTVVVHGE